MSLTGLRGVSKVPIENLLHLVVNALNGLLKAVSLGTRRWSSKVTQDMLCILTLWFKYGKQPEVNSIHMSLSTFVNL